MADTHLTSAILVVVDQQLRDTTPPKPQRTYEHLVALGYAPEDTRQYGVLRPTQTATGGAPVRAPMGTSRLHGHPPPGRRLTTTGSRNIGISGAYHVRGSTSTVRLPRTNRIRYGRVTR